LSSKEVIVSWLYTESEEDNGWYPQVGGNSSSQPFLDVYRRCLAVFFYSARRSNPSVKLMLFLNKPLGKATVVESKLQDLLNTFGVETVVMGYSYEPPHSFQRSWRNQFYVLDILDYLSRVLEKSDSLVVLDSDVIWAGSESSSRFWRELERDEILGYDLELRPEELQNGLSELDMAKIAGESLSLPTGERIAYYGGEFIAVNGQVLPRLSEACSKVYTMLMSRHELDSNFVFEEAHVLSLSYASLGLHPSRGDRVIKRIWTQPLKTKNRVKSDLELSLLHIPAEKKYGFRRFYNHYLANYEPETGSHIQQNFFKTELSRFFGIPRNSSKKWIQDVSFASKGKILRLFLK
jgi:hypothetical protein